ncbi:MCE family protein [Oxalobacteraceae bacterium OM1]|nr:MCE family protein [Oxalobacteraceae bacterium OM1]
MAEPLPPDTPDTPDTSDIPEAVTVRRSRWAISLVWLIPLLAILIAGWVAVHYVLSQGPTITIRFNNAEGLEAGKTKIRFKNVDIGTVKDIAIGSDRTHVIVTADIAKSAEGLMVAGTRFWVVRPRITFGSISGLGTLLSGAYIGADAGKSQEKQTVFTGLDTPPAVTSEYPGRAFRLHAEDIGSLYVGAPVYFRRVAVGEVTGYTLDPDGKGVTIDVFVTAPNDKLVTANSRFWQASGIDLSLQGAGIKLNTTSLISIIVGGISFQPAPDTEPGPPAPANATFTLFGDQTTAMRHVEQEVQHYLLYFTESLSGVAPGTPVDFRGITIGEVKNVSVEYDRGGRVFRFPVEINIYPARLRSRYRPGSPQPSPMELDPHVILDYWVSIGFRAQLRTANLITGQRVVALDFLPHASPAKVDWSLNPPAIPTAPGAIENIQESLASIAAKLDKVPFDAIGNNLNRTLKSLDTTLQGADKLVRQLDTSVMPEVRETLGTARKALGNAQNALATDAPVQQDLRETLNEVGRTARSLRELADYLNRHPEALIRGRKGEP